MSGLRPVVYVVEDDQSVREGIVSLLESVNLAVISFPSAEEFIAKRRDSEVACLVCDIRLPGMSGLELQKVLLREKATLPLVFISGHGDIPMSVHVMKRGAMNFLAKPFREEDLLDAVREGLSRAQEIASATNDLQKLVNRYATLSSREKEVMDLVCSGLFNKQIAYRVNISEVTVKVHRHNIMRKLGVRTLPALVRASGTISKALETTEEVSPERPRRAPPISHLWNP